VTATEIRLPSGAEEFLLWLRVERGRSPATLEAYRRDLRAHVAWLDERHLDILASAPDDLVHYARDVKGTGLAPSSVARSMVAVRSLYRFLELERLRSDDPTRDLETPRVPRGLPKALSERQVAELLAAVEGDDPPTRRDRALLELLYGTGARVSEVVGMSLSDLDLADSTVRLFGKGSKERVVPLGRYAHDALVRWLAPSGRGALEPERWASRDDSDAVFLNRRGSRLSRQGGWGVVKKYGAKVGLGAALSPHTLRHCCATHMLEHGADIRTVQELLGHASITTTQVYTKVSREQLTAAYVAAHPRARG
jgi:integrase/recombinase XerD